jgi:hypothetical protein
MESKVPHDIRDKEKWSKIGPIARKTDQTKDTKKHFCKRCLPSPKHTSNVQQQPQHGKAQSQSHRHCSGGRRPRSTPQDDDDAEKSNNVSVSAAAPVGMACDSSEDGVWMTNGKRARASAAHVHDADAESSDNERSTVVTVTTTTSSAHNAQSGMKACCRKHQTSIASISVAHCRDKHRFDVNSRPILLQKKPTFKLDFDALTVRPTQAAVVSGDDEMSNSRERDDDAAKRRRTSSLWLPQRRRVAAQQRR